MSEVRIGKLIVIEGTDGSGKATQVKALEKKAREKEISVRTISFPRYETPTGQLVERYLNGEFGNPIELNPYLACLPYADDRAAASPVIKRDLLLGMNVLCDRYIGSNFAHQAAKLPEKERGKFVGWLEKYEFECLNIPKPDLTICLGIPVEEVMKAIEKEGKKKDGHEANLEYQKKVTETYLWLAKTRKDWVLVECMKGKEKKERKSEEELTEEIWKIIEPMLFRW